MIVQDRPRKSRQGYHQNVPPGRWRRLGDEIARLRMAYPVPMRQEDLAAKARITPGYVGRVEKGRNRPRPEVLRDIARALDVKDARLLELAGYTVAAPEGADVVWGPEVERIVRRLARLPAAAARKVLRSVDLQIDVISESYLEHPEDRDGPSAGGEAPEHEPNGEERGE